MAGNKILANNAITMYDFDPDATTATAVGWVAIKDFQTICASFYRTVGTGTTALKFQAATDSSGTNATDVVSYSGSDPDAVGDYAFLETYADEIQSASDTYDFTHVSLVITFGTATDEGVVTYIRGGATFPRDGLTSASIA